MRRLAPLSVFLTLAVTAAAAAAPIPRQAFDAGWQFKLSNTPDVVQLASDAVPWQSVDLPHDWSIGGPIAQANPTVGRGDFSRWASDGTKRN